MKRLEVREVRPEFGPYDLALNVRGRGIVALRGDPEPLSGADAQRGGDDKLRRVQLSVYGTAQTSSEDVERALRVGHDAAGLGDDPGDFTARLTPHPVLGPLATRFARRAHDADPTVFGAFMMAVSEQLVTWAEAQMAMRRIWRRYGERISGLSRLSAADTRRESFLVVTPRAERIAELAAVDLRPLGSVDAPREHAALRSAQRPRARAVCASCPIEEAMRRLQAMPGVGRVDGERGGHARARSRRRRAGGGRGRAVRHLDGAQRASEGTTRRCSSCSSRSGRTGRGCTSCSIWRAAGAAEASPGCPSAPCRLIDRHRLEPWRT